MEIISLFNYDSCRRLDSLTETRGISGRQLMGQAALACLYSTDLSHFFRNQARFILLAGKGNNGGDGYAMIWHLLSHPEFREELRKNILIFSNDSSAPDPLRSDADFYRDLVQRSGIQSFPFLHFTDQFSLSENDIIVEAVLGTGQKGTLKPELAALVSAAENYKLLNKNRNIQFISIDVPLGLSEDLPEDQGLFPADILFSIGTEKTAVALAAGRLAGCTVKTLPAGFDPEAISLLASESEAARIFSRPEETAFFFRKKPDWHKYAAGYTVIAGGSAGMEGALLLSAAAFFAAGGGIARAVTPSPSFAAAGPGLQPSLMWMTADALPQTERDQLSFRSPDSIVIGPGLSREDSVHYADAFIQMIRKSSEERLMRNQTPPFIILDATACSLIFHSDYPEPLRCRTLLTPHTGEWASLGGSPIHSEESLSNAVSFSMENLRCWSLIKDAVSVLIPPAEDSSHCSGIKIKPLIFPHPEPSLATAGTGDSLSGILAAAFSGKRGHLHDPSSLECAVQQKIHHSLNLLHAAVSGSVHPVSADFAAGIRRSLL